MLVTVGIPFVNNERTLAEAIRSVFAQTHTDWELILVDDGSTDGSPRIAERMSDHRVRVYSDAENCGLAARLNQMAELARGEYLARMDADDVMHPDRLARQVEYFDSNPGTDVVGTGAYTIDGHGEPRGMRGPGPIDASPRRALTDALLLHPTLMARTEWFRANPYDEAFRGAEDMELWCRTCSASSLGKVMAPLHFYRENDRPPVAYLKHYLRALHHQRKLIARHGPALVGRSHTVALLARTYAKGAVYAAATAMGKQRSLVRRRSEPLAPEENERARRVLRAVLDTPVPGLPAQGGPRIVYTTTAPQTLGFLTGLAKHVISKGFTVHAMSSLGPALWAFREQTGATTHAVDMPRRITPLRDLISFCKMTGLMRKIRPEIVHAHTPKAGLIAMAAAWAAGIPVRIYHNHGLPCLTATGVRRLLLRASEKLSCALATQVLCVSHSIASLGVADGLFPPGRVKVLLNGSIGGIEARDRFDPHRFGRDDRARIRAELGISGDAMVLGYVGRIVRDKGVAELVEAWRALREEFDHLHLLVVGEFESQDPVGAAVERELRTDARVHLAGKRHDMPPLYAAMDVFALPSHREGFGLAALEASAMALPVVATRIPGCVDSVVDGVTGTLVPPRDPSALAGAIRTYLLDSELRARHGLAGRERALRDFREEDMWEAVCEEYHRCEF